ncbi:MAG: metal ABC transporter permease [Thiovulaceae bacterium]|nr:metal ABC transporter permease [Sulfurimonadaceae bacterium]
MFEIFQFQFMQNALIAGLLISTMAAIMGSFIVLRRFSMISDTLAHVALVGVAVGLLMGQNPLWGAVIVSILVSWIIEFLRFYKGLYSDSIMAIFLSGSLAIAVILVSLADSFNSSLFAYLFGDILAVSKEDIITMFIVFVVMIAIVIRFYQQLFFVAFDEEVAQTSGINVKWLNILQMTLVAMVVALSIKIVGSLLIGAMMVIPVVAAMQFKRGFLLTMLVAIAISITSLVLGLIASYLFAIPSGAAIVVVALLFFVISLFFDKA